MTWSSTPRSIDFLIEKEPFGVGGFHQAFKATSSVPDFCKTTWVVKRYLERSVEDIHATNQSVEHHTKKVVQMHYLARNFAARLQEELEQSNSIHQFGPTLQYNKVFLGMIDSEYVTVENMLLEHLQSTSITQGTYVEILPVVSARRQSV